MTNDLERWLSQNGWKFLRNGKGDHRILVFPATGAQLAFPAGRRLVGREFHNLRAAARRGMLSSAR